MPLLYVLEILMQIYFAAHAIRTGKDRYWIFIILAFPVMGSLVYFIVEFLPDIRYSSQLKQTGSKLGKMINPGKHLRLLEEQTELSPSLKNKKELAQAYIESGLFDKAIVLYQSCLEGININDETIIEGLSCAYFFKRDFERAKESLLNLMAIRKTKRSDEFDLLFAKSLEELGDIEGALREYAAIVKGYSGEEARCRYALLLKRTGKAEESAALFNEILKNARLSPAFYKKAQKQWIDTAKKELKTSS
ncbi:MAG: hypothetical protein BWK80_07665 [Desulfobacteraceae bacterium IS3]|nr:MAG: hypothetical protein BWK80_07665 [Desulfobacteraceae bacterium IS3]